MRSRLGSWSAWGVLALGAGAALAQVPGETTGLLWCAGPKSCLEWAPVLSATSYNVYRGTQGSLPDLLTAAPDSCLVGSFAGTTTGTTIVAVPPEGAFHWYLVTAVNNFGEGSSGDATAGPRSRESFGPCAPLIVINEVDYDQSGPDSDEFVELYNPSVDPVDLTDLALVLVNGANQTEYLRVDLDSGSSAELLPGDYLVVATGTVTTPPATNVILFPAASSNVQNGAPDGLAIFDTGTSALRDALSYEGSITMAVIAGAPGTYNLVEGTATSAADVDTPTRSIGRVPNGSDTDDAATDWTTLPSPSPGASNDGGGGGTIVINEVDYDQPVTDADEFVELYNPSAEPVNLANLVLVFVNGANQTEYLRVDLSSGSSLQLLPGEYLVVATATVATPPATNVILFPGATNNVQNGAPDGIAIFDTATLTLGDALSYEGSITMAVIVGAPGTVNLVEGTPTAVVDENINPGALVRLPNGSDTNDAATDWSFDPSPSPGAAN